MRYNNKYRNHEGKAAPYVLTMGNLKVINPTPEQYAMAGYLPYTPPEPTAEEVSEQQRQAEIEHLKEQLAATDYIALKAVEGYDCDSLYPNWREERAELRKRINTLECDGAGVD